MSSETYKRIKIRVICGQCGKNFLAYNSTAKSCSSACRSNRRRENSLEAVKKYDREWHRKNGARFRTGEYRKKILERYIARHPEKIKSRSLLNRAVRRGDIIKERCGVCGKRKVHAHHLDYSKPFDVLWLCQLHHTAIHT